MWKNTSILFKITLLFIFSLISFLGISLSYANAQIGIDSIKQYNTLISAIGKMRQFSASLQDIKNFLEEEDFYKVELTDDSKQRFSNNTIRPDANSFNIGILQDGNNIFITLRTIRELEVYKDFNTFVYHKYYSIAFFGSFVLIIIYVMIIRQLTPLKYIKNEMTKMAKDNVFHTITYKARSDEIGDIVREFNRCVAKIEAVDKSRALFLRAIMHELKTPITKGRIIAEMLNDEKQKQRLYIIFERLNTLINEFAKIEELASKSYKTTKNEVLLYDMVNLIIKMMFLDKDSKNNIVLESSNDLLKIDVDLFTLALENLIDNAMKYSVNGKVIIESRQHNLIVKNKGERLKLDINEYFKPYFKDVKNPLSQGFGLGMYIIKNALDAQNFNISYDYIDGYNLFTIHNCVIENFCNLDEKTNTLKASDVSS